MAIFNSFLYVYQREFHLISTYLTGMHRTPRFVGCDQVAHCFREQLQVIVVTCRLGHLRRYGLRLGGHTGPRLRSPAVFKLWWVASGYPKTCPVYDHVLTCLPRCPGTVPLWLVKPLKSRLVIPYQQPWSSKFWLLLTGCWSQQHLFGFA